MAPRRKTPSVRRRSPKELQKTLIRGPKRKFLDGKGSRTGGVQISWVKKGRQRDCGKNTVGGEMLSRRGKESSTRGGGDLRIRKSVSETGE